jgi:RNA polymerase sigma factor (sigma-70 family)
MTIHAARRVVGQEDGDAAQVVELAQAPGRQGIAIERARPAQAQVEAAEVALTPREREVLDWVAAGKTNREIATILGASPRTVEKHLERIYEKIGIETRTAAVMRPIKALRRG